MDATVADMHAQLLDSMRELHSRINDGIHVRLLWREEDDRVVVAVDDAKTGDSFVLDVHAGERAMEVFQHPYAYAAWHRVPTRPAVLALAA
jgi:hypothetical protein